MKLWQEFVRPESISEAVLALSTSTGPACLMAGGTDLMLDIQQGRHSGIHTIVDITSIPGLDQIAIKDFSLHIGATAVLSRVAGSPLVIEHARALSEACSLIGGPQVRNVATLGGNVAHALPAADGTIAMMALDTRVEVASRAGTRSVPLQDMFLGPGKTALKAGEEIITGFTIPLRKSAQASAFKRIMHAQGIALPILNNSIWLERQADKISDLRIAAGPSGPTPRQLTDVEDLLRAQDFSGTLDHQELTAILDRIPFRTSPRRASADYRHHLVKELLVNTFMEAWNRAG